VASEKRTETGLKPSEWARSRFRLTAVQTSSARLSAHDGELVLQPRLTRQVVAGRSRVARAVLAAYMLALPGCSDEGEAGGPSSESNMVPAAPPRPVPLQGVRTEPSGFATIDSPPPPRPMAQPPAAPPPPPPPPPAPGANPPPRQFRSGLDGLQRQTEEAYALDRRLRARWPDEYVGLDFDHGEPQRRALFLFRRDGAARLAEFTRRPDFIARDVRYTTWDLARLQERWMARLEPLGLVDGGGAYLGRQVVELTMRVPRAEFEAIAREKGWTVPETLALRFPPSVENPPVPARLRPLIRIFPRDDRIHSIRRLANMSGRIVLRDGCFRVVDGPGGRDALAYFSRGTELRVDEAGFVTLGRGEGQGRLGDMFTWNVGPQVAADLAMVVDLRRVCGNDDIIYVLDPHRSRM